MALQGCESSVDVIVAKPFLQLLMLVVFRIADGFQQAVVTWDATTVPRVDQGVFRLCKPDTPVPAPAAALFQ